MNRISRIGLILSTVALSALNPKTNADEILESSSNPANPASPFYVFKPKNNDQPYIETKSFTKGDTILGGIFGGVILGFGIIKTYDFVRTRKKQPLIK
jgi:hypothetical protein